MPLEYWHHNRSNITTRFDVMVLSDGVYRRIPLIWTVLGFLFLLLGLLGGSGLPHLWAYITLGLLCICRGIWVYQARWKVHKRNQMAITRETVIIRHPIAENSEDR